METLPTMTYEVTGAIARITLNRPDHGSAITPDTPRDLVACLERANLDPAVRVIALAGNGKGFCGGYDLGVFAEKPLPNHDPARPWDPVVDYQLLTRYVRAFMALFHSEKPVVCKVHGFCVAGGTDLALCADLLVIEDKAKIGYPPARVWGTPTTALWAYRLGPEKAKRLLFTGDCLSGAEAVAWGLAIESAPRAELEGRFESLLGRIARVPANQLVLQKLLVNQTLLAQGLAGAQLLGTLFDGTSRHTEEGYAFQRRAAEVGFRQAVRERDEPFGDPGPSTFKG